MHDNAAQAMPPENAVPHTCSMVLVDTMYKWQNSDKYLASWYMRSRPLHVFFHVVYTRTARTTCKKRVEFLQSSSRQVKSTCYTWWIPALSISAVLTAHRKANYCSTILDHVDCTTSRRYLTSRHVPRREVKYLWRRLDCRLAAEMSRAAALLIVLRAIYNNIMITWSRA